MTNVREYAKQLHHGMFASRDSTEEAFKYAYDVIKALDPTLHIYVITALHVVVNAISDELLRITQDECVDSGVIESDERPSNQTGDTHVSGMR